ncbi:low temperature requirement protein A [Staphylococcus simulans]|uniref:low temperature requirement protein A n=1 Tax=Staphylococcus simulans TaxID=1286 RepID=UPI000D0370FA|nr:low temperature requirement protein A [Staphylococcus simulans]MCD8915862.1 low temperature requirement protein A [Staphylococcus simulans]
MKKKEVSMAELFFDLVFVYVLSTINITVEQISSSLVNVESLGKNFMLFLVFFSIWIYHTLFINRFFEQKWYQYVFLFIDMFLILYLSKAINGHFQETFIPFAATTTVIFISIMIQYALSYKLIDHSIDSRFLKVYISGLALTVAFSIVGILLPKGINFWVYFVGIVISAIYPALFARASKENPVIFQHLTERLSLFMILLFGEGIVQIVSNMHLSHFKILDIVYFLMIISLFVIYSFHYKGSLDQEKDEATGFLTIYLHLFIIYNANFIFLIMNKGLSEHPLSFGEGIGYTVAFCVFLFGVFFDTILHRNITKKKGVYIAIILVTTLIGFIIPNIHLITVVQIIGIIVLCGMYYHENKDILKNFE